MDTRPMETQDSAVQEVQADLNQQFYGLTDKGTLVVFDLGPHPAAVLRQYQLKCEADGREPEYVVMILNPHQYRVIHSAVMAELADVDGDQRIPTYVVVAHMTNLPIFPHASVDTEEEVLEFIEGYPLKVAGPYKLSDVRDHWPAPIE